MKPRTRLYTPNAGAPTLNLSDPDSLAVRRSLRLAAGDFVACFNGDGREHLYRIESSIRGGLYLIWEKSFANPLDFLPETRIFIAATKGKTKDQIVKELTPLGATMIAFFTAERSVCRLESHALDRFRKIAVESCRQCGRSTIPAVEIYDRSLLELCGQPGLFPQQTLLFWEGESSVNSENRVGETSFSPSTGNLDPAMNRKAVLSPLRISDPEQPVALIFGPEGGFTGEEINAARDAGFSFCTLGLRILRSELAVIVGVTLAQVQRNLFAPESTSS